MAPRIVGPGGGVGGGAFDTIRAALGRGGPAPAGSAPSATRAPVRLPSAAATTAVATRSTSVGMRRALRPAGRAAGAVGSVGAVVKRSSGWRVVEDGAEHAVPAMTRPDHDRSTPNCSGPPTRPAGRRGAGLPCARGSPLLSRSRCERHFGQHGPVRRRAPGTRRRGHRDRPAQAPGRGGSAGLPPGRSGSRRRRGGWPFVRGARGEPGRRRARRAVRRPGAVQLSPASARVARADRRADRALARHHAARSCCCRANPTRSPRSTCCARQCPSWPTPSS